MNGMEPKRLLLILTLLVWGGCVLYYIVLNDRKQTGKGYESMSSLTNKNVQKTIHTAPSPPQPSVSEKITSPPFQRKVFPITYLNFDFLNQTSTSSRNIEVACSTFISSYFSRNIDTKIPPIVVGYGDDYAHWKKFVRVHDFLISTASDFIHEEDLIFFFDGLDSMFTGEPQDMIKGYMDYLELENFREMNNTTQDWPIIFNCERNKWPSEGEFAVFVKNFDRGFLNKYRHLYPVKTYCPRDSGFLYLNSGMYLGRKKDIKKFFKIAVSIMHDGMDIRKVDDQAVVHYLYIEKKFPIIGDCQSSIFLASYLACEYFQLNSNGCTVSNKLNPLKYPQAVHSNGPKCNTYCPCLYENMQRSEMRTYLERETTMQNVSSIHSLQNVKNNLRIDLYLSDNNKIMSVPLTKFCSEKSLFHFNKDNCLKK
ncbi:hypothetical protein C9374_006359 [Naegleria lovaniensis]|uniref:Uncharacterized protein n=1 Tax=Naegleria lovaniensis TaxID=51637 RepID=A0AA88GJN9_NAELO|nr:uncharacterized protein C9374_006359 [Naegleria lovaniensis]KAG2381370.1 hypothetical protein C9374_006359 [Naegleria lovaniensis]